jgi:hypothetical protein
MLALPILFGIAASRFVPGHLLLAAAAVAAYLASATLQAWLRARRRPSYVPSIVAYSAATALFGIALLALESRLLLVAIVVVPAGAVTLAAARPGTPRELVLSLAHVAQASVLVQAAMLLAGETNTWVLGAATAIAAAEMAGSVLAVRSVIRERDSVAFAARSVGLPRGDHAGGSSNPPLGVRGVRRMPHRPCGCADAGAAPARRDRVGAPADPCRAHRSDRIDRPHRRCSRRPSHGQPPVMNCARRGPCRADADDSTAARLG